jgi:hypothetical protein
MAVALLIALVGVSALSRFLYEPAGEGIVWNGFLFGVPMALAGLIVAGARWALMASVIYGTIGLALDLATLVQSLSHDETRRAILLSLLTGGLNLALVVAAWSGFISGAWDVTPPASRPPNLPSPPSA